jgi:DNA modification methylase
MTVWKFENNSIVEVRDIFEPIPAFMLEADCIFTDLPYNLGLLNGYYTKAGRTDYKTNFECFYQRFFECIDEIKPKQLFVEIGKQYIDAILDECKKRYKTVLSLDSYYYNKKNKCYVVYATDNPDTTITEILDGKNEKKIIELVCKHLDFECIGDLCMGKGLVGFYANKYNKRFVGTELNEKRLAVLYDRITRGKL